MKTQRLFICTACLTLTMVCGLGVQGARAQSRQILAKATIPFAFHCGSHVFPPGVYHLGMVSDYVLLVRGNHDTALAVVQWYDTAQQPANGELVFRHTGDNYTLQDLWLPQLSAHLLVPKGKTERRREVVDLGPGTGLVEVALAEPPR